MEKFTYFNNRFMNNNILRYNIRITIFLINTIIIFITVISISGCTENDSLENSTTLKNMSNITSAFKKLPEVEYFLTIYPNTSIDASYLSDKMVVPSSIVENSSKISYQVSVSERNSSIISWFDDSGRLIYTEVQNPPVTEDTSDRLLSSDNLIFNIVKIDSDIYVTFTGGPDEDQVDYFVITGNSPLGHQFESRVQGDKDGKPDCRMYNTAKLEGACSSCWLNFVMVSAIYTNGNSEVVLKARI